MAAHQRGGASRPHGPRLYRAQARGEVEGFPALIPLDLVHLKGKFRGFNDFMFARVDEADDVVAVPHGDGVPVGQWCQLNSNTAIWIRIFNYVFLTI